MLSEAELCSANFQTVFGEGSVIFPSEENLFDPLLEWSLQLHFLGLIAWIHFGLGVQIQAFFFFFWPTNDVAPWNLIHCCVLTFVFNTEMKSKIHPLGFVFKPYPEKHFSYEVIKNLFFLVNFSRKTADSPLGKPASTESTLSGYRL